MSVAYTPPCVSESCDTPIELVSAVFFGHAKPNERIGDFNFNKTVSQVCLGLCEVDARNPFEERTVAPGQCALKAVLAVAEQRSDFSAEGANNA